MNLDNEKTPEKNICKFYDVLTLKNLISKTNFKQHINWQGMV